MSEAPAHRETGFKLGAEPKKVALLGLVLAAALVLWWRNSSDSPSSANTPAQVQTSAGRQQPVGVADGRNTVTARPSRHRGGNTNERNAFEMRPIDASQGNVDPTLRLELLDRLSKVKMPGAFRSLFETGAAPTLGNDPGKVIVQVKPKPGPPQPPPDLNAGGPPPEPPAPPIPLKYYGFIRPANKKDLRRGFFMDGDIILVATEGETVKQRYRVVKFQDNSATMEDTVTKSQQSLALVPEARIDN